VASYLRNLIVSSGLGRVARASGLDDLWGQPENHTRADIVILEYRDDPSLDAWIAKKTAYSDSPGIFLLFPQASEQDLLKALALGVHGFFHLPVDQEDFQASVASYQRMAAWFNARPYLMPTYLKAASLSRLPQVWKVISDQ
jgi:DNA-binding NarL/FixJ family response regulator